MSGLFFALRPIKFSRLLILLCFFILPLICSPVYAFSKSLQSDTWYLITLPLSPADRTVDGMFGDDFGADGLCGASTGPSTWCIYTYDSNTGIYSRAVGSDTIAAGEGFWIIHSEGGRIEMDLPADSGKLPATNTAVCPTNDGCYAMGLPSAAGLASWAMLGSPFPGVVSVEEMRIQTDAGAGCSTGCKLDETNTANDHIWAYDSEAAEGASYRLISGSEELRPWEGFWMGTTATAQGTTPVLHIPDTSAETLITGKVRSTSGTPVEGAVVEIASQNIVAATDVNGEYNLLVSSGSDYIVRLSHPNHSIYVAKVAAPISGGTYPLDVTIKPDDYSTVVSGSIGFSLVGPDGMQVIIGPDQFVDESGATVESAIQVSMSFFEQLDSDDLRAIPGDNRAISPDGQEYNLLFNGAVEIKLSKDGNPVQLGNGASAQLRIPLNIGTDLDGTPLTVGDPMSLYYFNEANALWEEDGTGTIVADGASPSGFSADVTVSHFTQFALTWDDAVWEVDYGNSVPFRDVYFRVNALADYTSARIEVNESTNPVWPGWDGGIAKTDPINLGTYYGPVPTPIEFTFDWTAVLLSAQGDDLGEISRNGLRIGQSNNQNVLNDGDGCEELSEEDHIFSQPDLSINKNGGPVCYTFVIDPDFSISAPVFNASTINAIKVNPQDLLAVHIAPSGNLGNVTYAYSTSINGNQAPGLPAGVTATENGNTVELDGSYDLASNADVTVTGTDQVTLAQSSLSFLYDVGVPSTPTTLTTSLIECGVVSSLGPQVCLLSAYIIADGKLLWTAVDSDLGPPPAAAYDLNPVDGDLTIDPSQPEFSCFSQFNFFNFRVENSVGSANGTVNISCLDEEEPPIFLSD